LASIWQIDYFMIIALLKMNPEQGKRQEVVAIFRSLGGPLRVRQDCLACEVYEALEGEILYLEQWRSAEALHRHIQSALYMRILTAMELAAEAPEIHFHEVAGSKGMELIEALRGCEQS
jgi:quinol monooxygenase YgiN